MAFEEHEGLRALVTELLGGSTYLRTCRIDTVTYELKGQEWGVVLLDDKWARNEFHYGFATSFLKWTGSGWKDCEPTEHQRKIYDWMILLS